MTQTWISDSYSLTMRAAVTLQNIETNFAALKSSFSGTSAPSFISSGSFWYDTTEKVMRYRNYGNSAWLGIKNGNSSHKVWIYANAAIEGWTLDSSVTDKILAVKGGSTYATGGATAGSWTLGGVTISDHSHGLTSNQHIHYIGAAGGNFLVGSGSPSVWVPIDDTNGYWTEAVPVASYMSSEASSETATGNRTPTASQDATWRPAAMVGILVYSNA